MKKPIIELSSLEKTAVNTFTQKDFDELMKVYELGNWSLGSEYSPIKINFWIVYKEKTCVCAGFNYCGEEINRFEYSNKDFYLENNFNVISTKEFYKIQKITPEIITELKQNLAGKIFNFNKN